MEKRNIKADLMSMSPIGKFKEQEICKRYMRKDIKSASRARH